MDCGVHYRNGVDIMMQSRTHNCGELRISNVGESVTLVGWLENMREVGSGLGFVVLRDFYGTTQIVLETEEMVKTAKAINKESTISVKGLVRERSSKNPKQETGDIEVVPESITVLGRCRYNELPFEINHSREADETARLKYRYLDLRNPEVKKNIILRCNVIAALRQAMTEHGFMEITTPILTASSPEGARDYLVPARKHPGKFYALPQAPQQFKQLLMTAGFDRYFQIAPCFRDEDARGDRSPGEFYQLDMEMAFATQEDVFSVCEDVLPPVFEKFGTYDRASKAPFTRIPYLEAMEKYGSDKPDLRIDLTVTDVTETLKDCGFGPFASTVSAEAAEASEGALTAGAATGVRIKAVVISDFKESRKFIDKTIGDVEVQSGNKAYWFRMDENGELVGGISKFVAPIKDAVVSALSLKAGDLVVLSSGKLTAAQKTAGVIVKTFGAAVPGHMDKEKYEFCWIVDFPMYEIGEESGELEFCHNPFSMPSGGLETLLKAERGEIDPLTITADQYDLVVNGIELSSGAVRNHDPEIMIKAFEMVRLGEEDVKAKFPAMYNAFCYGAPPHAGIAPGVDRMVMLLAGEDSIREIIPFPMNKNAQDIMMGAPSYVTDKQLEELHIKTTATEE
ncbi:aspartyl-tRNA synthetase AspS [Butyrivibrio proteoclasticus B316]|uniref:Aspartate--tRNA ligase n=2 Tax=Butyrivibrio proteoclasticus TaxID=43305 RepID=E0RW24_BUTPB|nr:aspartyl-tRNA synthetase AspS [Butyrivibrio proteoclasticus B316]